MTFVVFVGVTHDKRGAGVSIDSGVRYDSTLVATNESVAVAADRALDEEIEAVEREAAGKIQALAERQADSRY